MNVGKNTIIRKDILLVLVIVNYVENQVSVMIILVNIYIPKGQNE